MKIIQIVPFFGETPSWFSYFIESCSQNPEITWMIYGDISMPGILPKNVIFKHSTLDAFSKLVSEKLSTKIRISHPYKICDYRPAYGKIFEEQIKTYDFWGYSDLDLIYGDISKFIPFNSLDVYDIISSRSDYFPGHFMLYKNQKKINNLYKKIYRYSSVFQDSKRHYAIDEHSNIIGKVIQGSEEPKLDRKVLYKVLKTLPLMHDINAVLNRMLSKGKINILRLENGIKSDNYFLKKDEVNWTIEWCEGELSDKIDNKKLMYFHFLKSKANTNFKIETFKSGYAFHIDPNGFRIVN